MRRHPAIVLPATLLASLVVVPPCAAAGSEVPGSPADVRPIEVGARAPDATVSDPAGAPVQLADVLAEGPSVLIFYRGGW